MKVTASSTYRSLLSQINRTNERLADLQLQSATGKKVNRPSDAPTLLQPVLQTRSQISSTEGYLESAKTAQSWLQYNDGYMGQVENLLIRAKEIIVSAGNATLSASDREVMADELSQLQGQLKGIANAKVEGKYLFAGYEDRQPPFDAAGNPTSSAQNADSLEMAIAPGEMVRTNVTAGELFYGRSASDVDTDGDGTVDPSGIDLFATLGAVEIALRDNDPDAATAQLDPLDAGLDQVFEHRGRLGNTANRVENAQSHMEEAQIDLEEVLSGYEDADIVETITQMTQQEHTLEAALSVTSRVSKISILDYL